MSILFHLTTVETIALQEKLIEGGNQKPDDGFLQSFAGVVGDHWPSLASLLSITAREIEEIKKEKKRSIGSVYANEMEFNRRCNLQAASPEASNCIPF